MPLVLHPVVLDTRVRIARMWFISEARVITAWLSHRITSLLYETAYAEDNVLQNMGQLMQLVSS